MSTGPFRRRTGQLLLWLLALVLLILAAIGSLLQLTLPRVDGGVHLAGPSAAIEIGRDSLGVVTIRAANEEDAAFALGYAHAQDRMFQMDFTRRLGAGRLSEVLGPTALPTDEFMRKLGIGHVAEANLAGLPAEVRRQLEAYADGVNAYLAGSDSLPAPEFLLLGYRPEPWRPADSLIWGRMMAWALSSNHGDEELRSALAARLPSVELQTIWPLSQRLSLKDDVPLLPAGGASNNWAISGSRSASGKPVLANDPHLGLDLPSPWYLARIEYGGQVLAGATAPGVPMVIIGRNDHVAWGFTTAYADVQDIFIETLLDGDRYATPQGPAPLTRREEVIRIRGAPPAHLTVLETRHGPLIDVDPDGRHGYALSWTGLRPDDRTAIALRAMNQARTAAEFRDALRDFESPVQNAVFADDAGNIGYIMAGRIPVRAHLAQDSEMPVPGESGDYDWTSVIPYDELPQGMNGPDGYFATANNRTMAADYAHFIAAKFDADYRIRRIRQILDGEHKASIETSAAMQMDSLSLAARELTPLLLAAAPEPALAAWDGRMESNLPQPLIFETWLRELAKELLAQRLGERFATVWSWDAALIVEALKGGPSAALCDDPATVVIEDCATQVRRAHDRAIAILTAAYGPDPGAWRWGDAHRARFPHLLLSRLPVIGPLFDLDVAAAGDYYTLDRAAPAVNDATGADFEDVHGASLRVVVDLADPDRSLFQLAVGQSGNPLSPHYADFAPLWRDGRYVTMVGVEEARLTLLPERAP
jgi:penicillin G amidase